MTARQVFEGLLTELSKINSPSMLLSEFNYYINKAVNLYVNKRYNIYDVNLQTTDDLRVLKATCTIKNLKETNDVSLNSYEIFLPDDYFHMLNCICTYEMTKNYKCYNKGNHVHKAAKRLTADSLSLILDDFYNRPSPEQPYYYINNVNLLNILPTNKYSDSIPGSTDQVQVGDEDRTGGFQDIAQFPRKISLEGVQTSLVEKPAGLRHSNLSRVRCEILYGKDHSVYKLVEVRCDYIKSPQYIRLTQEQVDYTEDFSLMMEFPDSVCLEIINELVTLVMEKTADPRLNTHTLVVLSIANPQLLLQVPLQKAQ